MDSRISKRSGEAVVKSLRWLLTEGWDHQDAAYSATFTFRLLFHSPIVQAPRLHSSVPGRERRVMQGKLGELNYDMSDKDARPVQRIHACELCFVS